MALKKTFLKGFLGFLVMALLAFPAWARVPTYGPNPSGSPSTEIVPRIYEEPKTYEPAVTQAETESFDLMGDSFGFVDDVWTASTDTAGDAIDGSGAIVADSAGALRDTSVTIVED